MIACGVFPFLRIFLSVRFFRAPYQPENKNKKNRSFYLVKRLGRLLRTRGCASIIPYIPSRTPPHENGCDHVRVFFFLNSIARLFLTLFAFSLPRIKQTKKQKNRFLSPEEIRKAFEDAGVDIDSPLPITTSCGSGVTAAVLTFALELAGRKAELSPVYDGAWAEWGSRDDLPRSTGN